MSNAHALIRTGFGLALLLAPGAASAQTQDVMIDSAGTAWLVATALLALVAALPGLALFHSGRSAPRHALAVAAQALLVAAVVSIAWPAIGYSLAYAPGSAWLGGGANLLLANMGLIGDSLAVPEPAFVFYTAAGAIIAAILATMVLADRVRLGWLLPFSALWTLVVFAPVSHWLSADGWLAGLGTVDLAGGLAIHLAAGASALSLALLAGPATGGKEGAEPGFSPLLTLTGVGLAWIGLLAYLGGGAFAAPADAASAILMAHVCCVSALLAWAGLDRLAYGKASATGLAKGAMAGMVVASALAGVIGLAGAIVAGAVGALICRIAETALPSRLRAADPLGIVAIHGFGGLAGALMLAPLASGLLGGPGLADGVTISGQLLAQLGGIALIGIWSALASAIIGFGLTVLVPMRVSTQSEQQGLSLARHGEHG